MILPKGCKLDNLARQKQSARMLEISPVVTAKDVKEFVRCAAQFYIDRPAWVPLFEPEAIRLLDERENEYFHVQGNRAAFFLARRDGRVVGRIAAFRNAVHLEANHDDAGFFGFFECENDIETAKALLAQAESWLSSQGLKFSRGPANFNVQEEAGVLLDGFDVQPMLGMAYTPPYYKDLIEAAGYAACRDLLVYRLTPEMARFDQLDRIAAAAQHSIPGLTVRSINLNDLASDAKIFARVFADAWHDNWGVVPISEKEFLLLYQRFRFFLIPEMVYVAEVNGEPAGAFVTMPDLNVLMKEIHGRLWPFGWWNLLTGRHRVTRYRTMMMGVRPQFRQLGLPLIFINRCRQELLRRKFTEVEFSWVLEENRMTRRLVERIGAKTVQTLRVFEKTLL
jgi:GNAT superfamily N-acetyltransferase